MFGIKCEFSKAVDSVSVFLEIITLAHCKTINAAKYEHHSFALVHLTEAEMSCVVHM